MHEDFLQDLRKLYSAIQLYQTHWSEFVTADSKLKQVDKQVRVCLPLFFCKRLILMRIFFSWTKETTKVIIKKTTAEFVVLLPFERSKNFVKRLDSYVPEYCSQAFQRRFFRRKLSFKITIFR